MILGGSWPKEEDEVADRYIQFGISIPEGKTFTVDNISFVIAGSGGNGMCYRARYFKSSDISAVMTLSEQKNMSNGVLNEISVNPMLELYAGEILYIRISLVFFCGKWENDLLEGCQDFRLEQGYEPFEYFGRAIVPGDKDR